MPPSQQLTSPVDTAAGEAFDTFRKTTALTNERGATRLRKWKVRRFEVLGRLLERWFLKTAINICVAHPRDLRWLLDGSDLATPPPILVRAAFGREPLEKPMGMYVAGAVGEEFEWADVLHFAPLITPDQQVVAGLFVFRGLRFVLHLHPSPLPPTLSIPNSRERRWGAGELLTIQST